MRIFVLISEDNEILGAGETQDTVKNLARDYCQDAELTIKNVIPRGDCLTIEVYTLDDTAFNSYFYIEPIEFYREGTLFPVDVGGDRPIEIPEFLRRQAE